MKGIIAWAADKPAIYNGKMNLSFKIGQTFYNLYDCEGHNLLVIKKGNEISFTVVNGAVKMLKLIKKAEIQPESDIVKISGKDHMLYKGLLALAHEKDPNFSMEITESFVNPEMTMAWCKVRLTSKMNQVFDGFGSSSPANTGKMTQSHPVEMAHTRAKGRALRDFVNIGVAMAEELKHDD